LAAVAVTVVLAACGSPAAHEAVAKPPPISTTTAPTSTTSAITTTTTSLPPGQAWVTAARLISARFGIAAIIDRFGSRPQLLASNDMLRWRDVTPRGMTGVVEDLFALDTGHWWATTSACAAGSGSETVWQTVDGGVTWSSVTAGGHPCAAGSATLVRFIDASHGWLVNLMPTGPAADLWATADGGRTWAKRDERLPELGTVAFRTPEDGYLGDAGLPGTCGTKLYATHDGGATWSEVNVDLSVVPVSYEALYGTPTFSDAEHGVLPLSISKANTEMLAWYVTGDGGSTWTLRSGPLVAGIIQDQNSGGCLQPALTSVASPTVWWAAGQYRQDWVTHITSDGGRTWADHTATPAWPHPTQIQAVDDRNEWLEAGNGALLATNDGGDSADLLNPHVTASGP